MDETNNNQPGNDAGGMNGGAQPPPPATEPQPPLLPPPGGESPLPPPPKPSGPSALDRFKQLSQNQKGASFIGIGVLLVAVGIAAAAALGPKPSTSLSSGSNSYYSTTTTTYRSSGGGFSSSTTTSRGSSGTTTPAKPSGNGALVLNQSVSGTCYTAGKYLVVIGNNQATSYNGETGSSSASLSQSAFGSSNNRYGEDAKSVAGLDTDGKPVIVISSVNRQAGSGINLDTVSYYLTAYDASSGSQRWQVDSTFGAAKLPPGSSDTQPRFVPFGVAGPVVVGLLEQRVGKDNKTDVVGVNLADGQEAWRYTLAAYQKPEAKDVGIDGFSISAQRDACYRRAEELGALVEEEYIDRGETARKASRPELQRMLQRIERDEDVDYVIVMKIDRLARNLHDHVNIAQHLRSHRAVLISVTENIDDSPSGQLIENVMATIAQFYSANLADEVSVKMAEKAKRGGTIGRAPIGYLNVHEDIDGKKIATVKLDPERAPHVRWAFETYATGNYSIRQIAEELESRGLKTRVTNKKGGNPVTATYLNTMLTNRYYAGLIVHRGQVIEGRHEALIERETFDLVQAILEIRRNGERQRTHMHYLKGTIHCARCGSRLGFTRSRGRHGGEYDYFYCLARQQKKTNCDLPNLPVEHVEDAVETYYGILTLSHAQAERLRDLASRAFDHRQRFAAFELERQQALTKNLLAEQDRLVQALRAGHLAADLYAREQRKIEQQITGAQRAIKHATIDLGHATANLEQILACLEQPQDSYRRSGPVGRKQHNKAFFERIDVDTEGVVYARLKEPYALLHERGFADDLEAELKDPDHHGDGRGSIKRLMVELRRLELLTSCMPCKRSTN